MNKSNNRSVIKTKKLLKNGLLELLDKKSIEKITVKELTDYVDINRGTFYLHYKDIYDLLENTENEMIDDFYDILQSHQAMELNGKPFELLKDIFIFLSENVEFGKLILGKNRNYNFINKLKNILREKCFKDWDYFLTKENNNLYEDYYEFIISGSIGIIENWLFSDMKRPPKEMALITEDIILKGIDALKK